MENVVLTIHLLLALALIGVVLMQRSEGGGLGIGGGGGGAMSSRSAATAMGKLTWILAAAFIATSITLTIFAAQGASNSSVLDRISEQPAQVEEETGTDALDGGTLLPPSAGDDAPLTPTLE